MYTKRPPQWGRWLPAAGIDGPVGAAAAADGATVVAGTAVVTAVATGAAADVTAADAIAATVVDGVVVIACGVLMMSQACGAVHEMLCAALTPGC